MTKIFIITLKSKQIFWWSTERTINTLKFQISRITLKKYTAEEVLNYYQIKIDFHFSRMTHSNEWFQVSINGSNWFKLANQCFLNYLIYSVHMKSFHYNHMSKLVIYFFTMKNFLILVSISKRRNPIPQKAFSSKLFKFQHNS